ncbi:hypothetical protein Tco_0075189, partial [Tanacetum coccineum]
SRRPRTLDRLRLTPWIGSKMAPKKSGMSVADIEELITQRVTEALAAQDTNRNSGNRHNSDTNSFGGGERTTRVCTYKDFVNCQPLNFKGIEWTYATCILLGGALTWWNSHVRSVGHDAAYVMSWKTLMKMVTENYYPRSEIKKLEIEL